MTSIPANFKAITIEEISAAMDAIYEDAFKYGGILYKTKAQRDRVSAKTRPWFKAVTAISYGFTPVAYNASWAGNPTKAFCDECGHAYAIKNTRMMYSHAYEKHGREDFPSTSAMLEAAREAATA